MARLKHRTYAENLQSQAKNRHNPQRRVMDCQDLADLLQYSYEHIRKLWQGNHEKDNISLSPNLNQRICAALGLSEKEMYALHKMEKFAARFGYLPPQLEDPKGREVSEVWGILSEEHKDLIVRISKDCARAAEIQEQSVVQEQHHPLAATA